MVQPFIIGDQQMKRFLVVMAVLVLVGASVSALEFNIGPKVSIGNYAYRGPYWRDIKDTNDIKDKISASFAGGVFINPQFTPLFGLQLEALYTRASLRYGDSSDWVQYSLSSFTIPVYARLNFDLGGLGIYALAGPRFDFLFGKVKYKDSDGITSETALEDTTVRPVQIGAAICAGVMLSAGPGKLDIGLNYNTTFNTFTDSGDERYIYGLEIQLGYGFLL